MFVVYLVRPAYTDCNISCKNCPNMSFKTMLSIDLSVMESCAEN